MKIICIGRNYQEHAKELNNPLPAAPMFFMKPETALLAEPFFKLPSFSNDVHYEVEIVLKINKTASCVTPDEAEKYFSEIALGIDFTARDIQAELKAQGHPWEKAKAFDGSALVSEFFDKNDFNLAHLNFGLKVNQQWKQRGNTGQMIFDNAVIISEASKYFTLQPGDLIYTGTPAGVGALKSGDLLDGFLENNVVFQLQVE